MTSSPRDSARSKLTPGRPVSSTLGAGRTRQYQLGEPGPQVPQQDVASAAALEAARIGCKVLPFTSSPAVLVAQLSWPTRSLSAMPDT